MAGNLPEAVLRFEPQITPEGAPGSLQRAVVLVDDKEVGELVAICHVSYDQTGVQPGHWTVELFADSVDPLSGTLKCKRPRA